MVCGFCKMEISPTDIEEKDFRVVDGKEVHTECYFDRFGTHVEEHPARPRGHRG